MSPVRVVVVDVGTESESGAFQRDPLDLARIALWDCKRRRRSGALPVPRARDESRHHVGLAAVVLVEGRKSCLREKVARICRPTRESERGILYWCRQSEVYNAAND